MLPVLDYTLAFVGLGSNLGVRQTALSGALMSLGALPSTELLRASSFYGTEPVDGPGPDYLNAVAMLSTKLDAHALLGEMQAIERAHGRQRSFPNAPRTLDLDLLLYGKEIIHSNMLQVPHPRMHERGFVLRPLAELVPDLLIPGRGPVAELLKTVSGQRTWQTK